MSRALEDPLPGRLNSGALEAAAGTAVKSAPASSLIQSVSLLDDLLAAYAGQIGRDYEGYRGHCYRVLNFCAALAGSSVESLEKIAVATAFHDIGIWTHGTFDYLRPSIEMATLYLDRTDRENWIHEIAQMIREHHKVRRAQESGGTLVDAFRRADWIDVTGGVLTFGLSRQFVRDAYDRWPSAGFHLKLVRLSWRRFKSHPRSPLPMLRW